MRTATLIAGAAGLFISPLVGAWIAMWLHDRPWRALARELRAERRIGS